jgi:protein-tyrosine-phosphatase
MAALAQCTVICLSAAALSTSIVTLIETERRRAKAKKDKNLRIVQLLLREKIQAVEHVKGSAGGQSCIEYTATKQVSAVVQRHIEYAVPEQVDAASEMVQSHTEDAVPEQVDAVSAGVQSHTEDAVTEQVDAVSEGVQSHIEYAVPEQVDAVSEGVQSHIEYAVPEQVDAVSARVQSHIEYAVPEQVDAESPQADVLLPPTDATPIDARQIDSAYLSVMEKTFVLNSSSRNVYDLIHDEEEDETTDDFTNASMSSDQKAADETDDRNLINSDTASWWWNDHSMFVDDDEADGKNQLDSTKPVSPKPWPVPPLRGISQVASNGPSVFSMATPRPDEDLSAEELKNAELLAAEIMMTRRSRQQR